LLGQLLQLLNRFSGSIQKLTIFSITHRNTLVTGLLLLTAFRKIPLPAPADTTIAAGWRS
ncbi:MAG: hypothetical protein AB2704_15010, partial [Candidatus Thiodiazotropha taylori]